jgi:xylulose-5-phosphate/fructose-6-phosphate phosphoketolase
MALAARGEHPHGMDDERFVQLFGRDEPVIFAFHGYPGAVHQLLHGRPSAHRFHVRGFREEGTTTTPFDMVVLNQISRYHLCIEALKRSRRTVTRGESLADECRAELERHRAYIRENLEDMPEIRDWKWSVR